MLDQKQGGVAARRDLMLAQGVPDHCGEIARCIGIATDRRSMPRCLECAAQRRARGQIARLEDDEGIAGLLLQKLRKQFSECIARTTQLDDPPPAGEAQLSGFIGEACGIRCEHGSAEIGNPERVLQIETD
jgi:hypothetical protein